MSDIVQYIIVGIVVAGAFVVALRSIYRAIKHKKSALITCDNCKLKGVCEKKGDSNTHCNMSTEE